MSYDDSPRLRPGARIEQKIPLDHPWFQWLSDMDRSGLMQHGVMTVNLGGIEQRYDLVEVWDTYYDKHMPEVTVIWRMYGEPQ